MPKGEVSIEDQLRRLEGARNSALAKLGKNGAGTKADGDETAYALACNALFKFVNEHGLGNHMIIKKKHSRI